MRWGVWVFRALTMALLAAGPGVQADELASYRGIGYDVVLMTEACDAKDGKTQRARKRRNGTELHGCWSVNAQGNPVVRWSDGQVDELSESRVRLAPRYAAMLNEDGPPPAAARGSASAPGAWRPEWCDRASFPHERLICEDDDLLASNRTLAGLWRSYSTQLKLTEVQLGRVRSDYFKRLRACGASKPCVSREQAAQIGFYRKALAQRR